MKTRDRWACPSGIEGHDTFLAAATERQTWLVGEDGDYVETAEYGDGAFVDPSGATWRCAVCQATPVLRKEPVPETEVERLTRELAEAKAEIARLISAKAPPLSRQYHIAKSDALAMEKIREAVRETTADHGDDGALLFAVRYDFILTLHADGVEAWDEAKLNSVLTEHAQQRLSDDPGYEPEHWILTEGGSL